MDIVGTLGGDFIIYLMVVVQTVGICWIYGLDRFIRDIEFMLGIKLSAYWKLTWAYIIPLVLIFIFCYAMATYTPLREGDYVYPSAATGTYFVDIVVVIFYSNLLGLYTSGFGWFLAALALLQLPLWAVYVVYKQEGFTVIEVLY